MMRIKSLIYALISVMTFTMLMQPAVAALPESEINIQFAPGNEVINPVDPDDPSLPLQPPGMGTGESGPLTLNYMSPIDFGIRPISSEFQVYPALTMKPFIQVTDLRGSGTGWEVEATASPFMGANGISLRGSIITFQAGEAISANPDLAKPVPFNLVELPTDGITAVRVVRANTDEGRGTWVIRWYPSAVNATDNDNVTLTVQRGTATIDANTATISWRLVDAP